MTSPLGLSANSLIKKILDNLLLHALFIYSAIVKPLGSILPGIFIESADHQAGSCR